MSNTPPNGFREGNSEASTSGGHPLDHSGPPQESQPFALTFFGPFSWVDSIDAPSLFYTERREEAGVYLWTVSLPEGYLVYYVGETGRSFEERMVEHYKGHVSGMYTLNSPEDFSRGVKVPLWPGHYDRKNRKTVGECIAQSLVLADQIAALTRLYKFFLAPLTCERRLRRRVEAAIASALSNQVGVVGQFQEEDIHYEPMQRSEAPIRCTIESSAPLMGIPKHLSV